MTTSRTRKTSGGADAPTKKAPTKKSPAKKTGTKAPAKKVAKKTSRKASATKASATRAPAEEASTERPENAGGSDGSRRSAPRAEAKPKPKTAQIATGATEQLQALTGKDIEGITSLTRGDDGGWSVEVEVVEVRRIPNTTDVLALYEVTLDESGELEGYQRLRRYARGVPRGD